MACQTEKLNCSVGVIAYNEEKNIASLLDALLDQRLCLVEITEIIVVASACTDQTVPIVQTYSSQNCRIKLIEQLYREGKTSAVNLFIANAQSDICVLESGDTLPHECAVERMVRMFADQTVGAVGARKVSVDSVDNIIGLLIHLRLQMEHELCLQFPRLGELIAFRKLFDRIPNDVSTDEAFVEASAVSNGYQVKYVPDAIVYNTGPTTIADLMRQRRRIHAGHVFLKYKYGYIVSSIQNIRVFKIAGKELWRVLRSIYVLFLLTIIEAISRLLGWYDFAIKRDRHVIWNMAWTQKTDVRRARFDQQVHQESFAASNRTPLE